MQQLGRKTPVRANNRNTRECFFIVVLFGLGLRGHRPSKFLLKPLPLAECDELCYQTEE